MGSSSGLRHTSGSFNPHRMGTIKGARGEWASSSGLRQTSGSFNPHRMGLSRAHAESGPTARACGTRVAHSTRIALALSTALLHE